MSMPAEVRVALLAEKVPYLLTLFVAACGWLVSYTVGRYEKAPLLEYSTSVGERMASNKTGSAFVTTLRSLSTSELAACARVVFTARSVGSRVEIALTLGEVGQLAGPITSNTFKNLGKSAMFQMELHPGAVVELPMETEAPAILTIAQTPCESEGGMQVGGALPVLMESSLKTWLIRHSLAILWFGIVAWALALCWVYVLLGRTGSDPGKPGGPSQGGVSDP